MKIVPIKSVDEVKSLYKFMVDKYEAEIREQALIPFPLSETYEGMIDLLKGKTNLQLKVEDRHQLMGFICANDKDKNGKDIYIQAIVVESEFLKIGVGKVLLKFLERNIRKAKYKRILIKERDTSNSFYIKSGYIPYLYVYAPNEKLANLIKKNRIPKTDFVEEYVKNGKYVIKFDVLGDPMQIYKKYFMRFNPSITAEYIYEKIINKK